MSEWASIDPAARDGISTMDESLLRLNNRLNDKSVM